MKEIWEAKVLQNRGPNHKKSIQKGIKKLIAILIEILMKNDPKMESRMELKFIPKARKRVASAGHAARPPT